MSAAAAASAGLAAFWMIPWIPAGSGDDGARRCCAATCGKEEGDEAAAAAATVSTLKADRGGKGPEE